MATKRYLGVALAAGLGLAALAGCGSSGTTSANPTQTVNNGFQADLNQPGLQMVVRLQGSPSSLGANSNLTPAQKQAILASHLVVSVHGAGSTPVGQVSATTGNNAVDVALVKGSDNLADLRFIGDNLYARVDIPKLTADYGLDKGSVANFRTSLNEIATQVTAAKALNDGKWVSVNVPQAEALVASQLHVNPTLLPHVNPGELVQVVDAVLTGLQHNSRITAAPVGGAPYQLTVNDKALITQLSQAIASTPGFSAIPTIGQLRNSAASVPAGMTTKVGASVNNGKVSRLVLPISQFDKSAGNAETIVDISSTGPITAPSGATPVDLAQVGALITQIAKANGGKL